MSLQAHQVGSRRQIFSASVCQGMRMMTRQAVVLVGDKGTRLGKLAAATPRPLMPIDADTVFLDELLFNIARYDFE